MSKTARQADVGFDSEDPRCNDGGPACEGCLMVGWCLGDYPPAETVNAEREYACCGALVTGPHKMGCDHKLNAAPTDHCEDILHMVPCAVCAVGRATLQRDASGYYRACEACGSDYAGVDELALRRGHVVDADKMVRPCRTCGPEGCADRVSCPRWSS